MQRGPTECLGIEIGSSAVKLARVKRSGSDVTVVGVDMVDAGDKTIDIPPRLRARYASIATSGKTGMSKLLSFPGAIDKPIDAEIQKSLGLKDDDDYRISYYVISEGQGRQESRVLAAAISEKEASSAMQYFSSGLPAPYSLEVSALATLTAFQQGPVKAKPGAATGLIDFGTTGTTLSLFNEGSLLLVRRFDFGTNSVLERVQKALGVDSETAHGILADTAFDISELLVELMSPVSSQFVVSRDYIERRENCSIESLYAIGGIAHSKLAMQGLVHLLGVEISPWDPFAGFTLAPQAIPEEMEGQRWRFAAALGAALETLEEE